MVRIVLLALILAGCGGKVTTVKAPADLLEPFEPSVKPRFVHPNHPGAVVALTAAEAINLKIYTTEMLNWGDQCHSYLRATSDQ